MRPGWRPMGDQWMPDQDDALRRLAGTAPIDEVAAELTRRFGIPRTVPAVRIRCKRLGISAWAHGYPMCELGALFGLGHRAVVRWWVAPGLLPARRWSGRGPNAGWWFEPVDVERFVREHPWAYDAARMRPGHRLTRLAEVIAKRERWLTLEEAAPILRVCKETVRRWCRRGLLPGARLGPAPGASRGWRIPAAALRERRSA